jgi:N-acetylmuramoyl-L-alanine amidase
LKAENDTPTMPYFTNFFPSTAIVVTLALLTGCATTEDESASTASTTSDPTTPATLASGTTATTVQRGGLKIDRSFTSENQDSRVLHIVLHYTVSNFEGSLRALTHNSANPVSSHYLVRDQPVKIYQLVDESQRAWHAGPSYWKGHTHLNASSIGIEIVNQGLMKTPKGEMFAPYPPAQINAVIALIKDIATRHKVSPDRIVGHSDIQPQNKQDPGPLFPWKQLADAGVIGWPNPQMVNDRRLAYKKTIPNILWFQERLGDYGFHVPHNGEFNIATRNVIAAFQMKYRPSKYDGIPDAETAALLEVVNHPDGMRRSGKK